MPDRALHVTRHDGAHHWHLFPTYTRWEHIADLVIHILGITAGLVGVGVLFALALPDAGPRQATAVALYAVGLIAMLSLSALYNLVPPGRAKAVLRRFDHAAIFLMIAGTYTPFTLVGMGGDGHVLLAVVWGIAVVGIVLKLAAPRRSERISLLLYLAMGWSIVFELRPLADGVAASAVALLIAGGVVYTLGVPFHLLDRLRFNNAIWHAFVLGGAVCHYFAVIVTIDIA
jgi:hemolysin III